MKLLLALAASALLASCSTYQDKAPAWMPGSGAVNVKLSGAEEVPPVNVPGSGSGTLRVSADGAVSGSVTTTGVQGTMAHIHMAPKGQNGPIIIPLDKNGDTYTVPPGRKLDDAQMKAFKEGRLYVNVHTARNKGGEVRGQLEP